MPDYRRYRIAGGCYFFTVNLLERHGNNRLTYHIDILRNVVHQVWHAHPFHIGGWVVFPEHTHAIWTLPPDEDNFPAR